VRDELKSLLTFVLNLLRDYGLDDFYLELSTRNEEKYVGSPEVWEQATERSGRSPRTPGCSWCLTRVARRSTAEDLRAGP